MLKKQLAAVFALVGWFALVSQLVLLLHNRITTEGEALARFFSYFTILTNLLVTLYFTAIAFFRQIPLFVRKPGFLTAITVYILVVGIVYQLALRHLWQPEGWQHLTDELLHSVMPLLVLLFWYRYEECRTLRYSYILRWLLYPLLYLFFILLRGSASGFYPYPFVDVPLLGITRVLLNAGALLLFFMGLSAGLLFAGKWLSGQNTPGGSSQG